jgi:hypothetical protein
MYTNPSNITKTLVALLDKNSQFINNLIHNYETSRNLVVLQGMRPTLPIDMYPCFEIEPGNADNQWATTRAQRPTFNFTCTVTVKVSNISFGVEYICSLATIISEIMTSPNNLQMRVLNETHWDVNGGLVDTYILDSLVSSITYNATKDGTIRTAEFSWFATIHEPFPESLWLIGASDVPTIIRPLIIVP